MRPEKPDRRWWLWGANLVLLAIVVLLAAQLTTPLRAAKPRLDLVAQTGAGGTPALTRMARGELAYLLAPPTRPPSRTPTLEPTNTPLPPTDTPSPPTDTPTGAQPTATPVLPTPTSVLPTATPVLPATSSPTPTASPSPRVSPTPTSGTRVTPMASITPTASPTAVVTGTPTPTSTPFPTLPVSTPVVGRTPTPAARTATPSAPLTGTPQPVGEARPTPTSEPQGFLGRLTTGKPFPWNQPALYIVLVFLAVVLFAVLFRLALARSRTE